MRHLNRLKLALLLGAVVVVAVGLYLALTHLGLFKTVFAPVALVVAGAGAVVKTVGGKPIPKNDTGRPRRVGTSGVSPKPKDETKHRARPRHNNWR